MYLAIGNQSDHKLLVETEPLIEIFHNYIIKIINSSKQIPLNTKISLRTDDNNNMIHLMTTEYYVDTFIFFVIVDEKFAKNQSMTYILRDFVDKFIESDNSEHKLIIKQMVEQYETSKIEQLQVTIDSVKETMRNNIEQSLENSDKLNDIEIKSDIMVNKADEFRINATTIKRNKLLKCIKYTALVAIIIIIVIIIVIISLIQSKNK